MLVGGMAHTLDMNTTATSFAATQVAFLREPFFRWRAPSPTVCSRKIHPETIKHVLTQERSF